MAALPSALALCNDRSAQRGCGGTTAPAHSALSPGEAAAGGAGHHAGASACSHASARRDPAPRARRSSGTALRATCHSSQRPAASRAPPLRLGPGPVMSQMEGKVKAMAALGSELSVGVVGSIKKFKMRQKPRIWCTVSIPVPPPMPVALAAIV